MTGLKMFDERMAICRACPELTRKFTGSFCNLCGCNMRVKAQMVSQDCPLDKWPKQ